MNTKTALNSTLAILSAVALAGCVSESNLGVVAPERIGVCSWSYGASVQDVAAKMEKDGIKGIHLALGPFIHADGRHGDAEGEEGWKFVKEQVASGKWNVMCTMFGTIGEDYSTLETIKKTGGIVPDATWEENQKIITRAAQLTHELGCKYTSGHAGFLDESDPVAFAKFVERVSWMADECAKYGVTLILESGQETAEDLAKFMVACNSRKDRKGDIGINFDPANMILYAKGRPCDAVKTLFPWIHQIHAKDALYTKVPGTWGQEVRWGDGQVQARELMIKLDQLGYTGNVVIEREGGAACSGDVKIASDRLQDK